MNSNSNDRFFVYSDLVWYNASMAVPAWSLRLKFEKQINIVFVILIAGNLQQGVFVGVQQEKNTFLARD